MRTNPSRKTNRRLRGEAGQALVFVVLALGIFLLGAIGFAVDMANLWFHRQAAQTAADAACTAGVMDLLANTQGNSLGGMTTALGVYSAFDCSNAAYPGSAPCKYASLNGYDGGNTVPGNDVFVSFPGSVPGATAPAAALLAGVPPYIRVDVLDNTQTFFSGLLSHQGTAGVRAMAACGLQQNNTPIPIIVLNPSCPHAFQLDGSTNVKIVGGPVRSIQVNSSNTSCAAATTNSASGCSASGPTIDLSKGGPNFNGSDFGLLGQPSQPPSGFTGALWGPADIVSDPYAQLAAPAVPTVSPTNGISATTTNVLYNVDGCPDHAGCIEYQPGLYNTAIIVKNITAIFVPGIYYFKGVNNDNCGKPGTGCVASPGGANCRYGLDVDSNGVLRPSTATGDGSSGTMFYFSGATGAGSYGSVFFGSNAGKPGGRTIDSYQTSNATCPGGAPTPSQLNLPFTVAGNVLLGQCTAAGKYIGTPVTGSAPDTTGTARGILFFQDRANADTSGQASMQGGGGLVISGNMYFHNCNASGTGTGCLPVCPSPGSTCSNTTNGWMAFYQLQGSSGSNAFVLGNITTDELVLGGGGNISMLLSPNAVVPTLKASLLQ